MMNHNRLIHRVVPHQYEDITGFLMRVAARNYVGGPGDLLDQILGSRSASVRMTDLSRLAYYCRNTVPEVSELSGLVEIQRGNVRTWYVAGEWVTKSSFVAPRRAKICPCCLGEEGYIRGHWCLTFYTVCAMHGVRLVNCCPACRRVLKWNRQRACRCGCGFDLASIPVSSCEGNELLVSRLIAHRVQPDIPLPSSPISDQQIEKLAALSLDGLLKTIWFVGHCIGNLGNCGIGHGHKQPRTEDATLIIERAFELLNDWPRRLGEHLLSLSQRKPSNTSASIMDRLLGPAQYYLREEINTEELGELRAIYEQHVEEIWRKLGRARRSLDGCRQLEFEFS